MNTNSTTSAVLLADVLIEITGRVNDLKDDVRSAEAAHDNKARELAVAMESVKSIREAHNKVCAQYETLKEYKDDLIGQMQNRDAKISELLEQLGHRENERDEAVQRLNDADKSNYLRLEEIITLKKKLAAAEEKAKTRLEIIKRLRSAQSAKFKKA